jgi:hypothetical protein
MRCLALSRMLKASTALVAVSLIALATLHSGEAVAQSTTTREKTITIERTPAPAVTVPQPPPPPRAEVQMPPPTPTAIWVPGYWTWNNDWVWVQGHWEQPPERRVTLVPGQWVQQGNGWAWRPGYWE